MNTDSGFGSKDNVYSMLRILSKQSSGLKIVHFNAQSLNNKMDEFRYIFTSSGIDVICISESWFHPDIQNNVYNLSGFQLFRADRKSNAGGVAIYVRNGINCIIRKTSVKIVPIQEQHENFENKIEYLFLEISIMGRKILIGSVYRPRNNILLDTLMETIEDISPLYNEIIIAGDFNSNLLVDNSLTDLFEILGLLPINTTIPTHFHRTSNSLLDLFFINDKSKVLFYDQLSAPVFSKHDLIFLAYDIVVNRIDTFITYRDFRNIDYTMLNQHIENVCWDIIYSTGDVDEQINFLQDNINNIFNNCIPLKTKLVKHKQQPWFNADIKRLIGIRDAAYHRWKKYKTSVLHTSFRTARRNVVRTIQNAKSSYFRRKFNSAVGSKAKWKEIRGIGIGRENLTVSNHAIDLNHLNNRFVDLTIPQPSINIYDDLCYVAVENQFSFSCVDQCDVLESFLAVKSNAMGIDGVNPVFLKALLPKLLPFITYLFNTILTKSIFPSGWKQSKIIPIPKSKLYNDFRPIAILPFLSKVLENVMHKQMNAFLHSRKLLSDRQSGFTKGRSCVTALVDVIEDVRAKLDDNMVSFLILLDHSKAFDTIDHSIMIKKLEKLFHFSKPACKLITSYLNNRTQSVHLNGNNSNVLNVRRGVPQGSILGPLLFCLYINDLPEVLLNSKVQMYADDVQVYTSTRIRDIHSCVANINNDLNRIHSWAEDNGLCINPLKSKCMLLSKRNCNLNLDFEIKINNTVIGLVESSSNLGVTFNSQLSWTNHINIVVGKVYGMLRNLWTVQESTPFEIRMLLAKSYLIPVLLYGCEIYSCCDSADFNKLNVAYNNIARYIYRKPSRAHISAFSYQIFNMNFENLLKFKRLILLHKIVYTKEPNYLYNILTFGRSPRGKKIIQKKFKTEISKKQFFVNGIRLWNELPKTVQIISNANKFKKELIRIFS